jgi:hypothetical protein
MTILRVPATGTRPEIWCRCDGGPHGFLSIAAHAHADALSIEVRHGGVDVLADPGTYCYHGEPQWRRYFRSTIAHNTLELDGTDQSASGGPFMWTRHARSQVLASRQNPEGLSVWRGRHTGYGRRTVHLRSVEVDAASQILTVTDEVVAAAAHACRLAFHLGPGVEARLDGTTATLSWRGGAGGLELPSQLEWSLHRGATAPPLGWYSPGFGRKEPTATLVGRGWVGPGSGDLRTVLRFQDQEGS